MGTATTPRAIVAAFQNLLTCSSVRMPSLQGAGPPQASQTHGPAGLYNEPDEFVNGCPTVYLVCSRRSRDRALKKISAPITTIATPAIASTKGSLLSSEPLFSGEF